MYHYTNKVTYSYARFSSGILSVKYAMSYLIFQYTYEPLGEYVIQRKFKSRVGYSRYATKKHCITILSLMTIFLPFFVLSFAGVKGIVEQ